MGCVAGDMCSAYATTFVVNIGCRGNPCQVHTEFVRDLILFLVYLTRPDDNVGQFVITPFLPGYCKSSNELHARCHVQNMGIFPHRGSTVR